MMLALDDKQFNQLLQEHAGTLPARILSHWRLSRANLLPLFTGQELEVIANKVVALESARPQASEASIALGADLWLLELAQRKRAAAALGAVPHRG